MKSESLKWVGEKETCSDINQFAVLIKLLSSEDVPFSEEEDFPEKRGIFEEKSMSCKRWLNIEEVGGAW